MSRRLGILSLSLGILMLLFGFLKFFEPFNGWFNTQIQQSHLPQESILGGKVGEMLTGFLFLVPTLRKQLTANRRNLILLAACLLLVVQMVVAIYVHLQPQVPASVLPLGLKPPLIPVTVLLLGLFTASDASTALRAQKASNIAGPENECVDLIL